ncbi:hypothetical protein D9M72_387070 [compost metagenome]
MSKFKSRYCSAISSWLFLLLLFTQKPAGVAWVIGTVVTHPAIFPDFLNFCQIGKCACPSGPTFNEPLFTRKPPPQEELAAAESVTIELAEAVSIKALETLLSLYNWIQLEPLPYFLFRNKSAILRVPVLIPSLTSKMIFLAFLFLFRVSKSKTLALP